MRQKDLQLKYWNWPKLYRVVHTKPVSIFSVTVLWIRYGSHNLYSNISFVGPGGPSVSELNDEDARGVLENFEDMGVESLTIMPRYGEEPITITNLNNPGQGKIIMVRDSDVDVEKHLQSLLRKYSQLFSLMINYFDSSWFNVMCKLKYFLCF